jgi:prepilin-type N-terminal cleavage/methylation domain-containing protein
MKKMKKQEAFTLIELLVVIAIIAILAISVAVGYRSVRVSANDAKRVEIARSIATAQELYNNTNGGYANCGDNTEEGWEDVYGGCDLNSGGFLNSNPNSSGIPRYNGAWWWTRGDSNGFRVFTFLEGKNAVFCCNVNGCKELEEGSNYNDCNNQSP